MDLITFGFRIAASSEASQLELESKFHHKQQISNLVLKNHMFIENFLNRRTKYQTLFVFIIQTIITGD